MTRSERILLVAVLALVFIGALVALTVVYREELRQVMIVPIQVGWQEFKHAWLGMGADFRWGVFIILLSALLFISFPSTKISWRTPVLSVPGSRVGRLAFWSDEIKTLLGHGPINRLTIFELRRLALEVIGFRYQKSTTEAGTWLLERYEAGDASLPPAMRLLVDPGAYKPAANLTVKPPNPIHLFRMLLGLSEEDQVREPALTASQLEAIIYYLEQVLEGSNDHDYR